MPHCVVAACGPPDRWRELALSGSWLAKLAAGRWGLWRRVGGGQVIAASSASIDRRSRYLPVWCLWRDDRDVVSGGHADGAHGTPPSSVSLGRCPSTLTRGSGTQQIVPPQRDRGAARAKRAAGSMRTPAMRANLVESSVFRSSMCQARRSLRLRATCPEVRKERCSSFARTRASNSSCVVGLCERCLTNEGRLPAASASARGFPEKLFAYSL
ncbi:hypothetical protein BV20DRAFT_663741 [Pilatotrama ljubarskyi]|nr:hypothetical protein BV20DRAFT_663741 [Pilatotrama ljubarskyi]